MLEKVHGCEIHVDVHLVVLGSQRDPSPHEGDQLFVTMEDSSPRVRVPSGQTEMDWENAWNVEPEFVWTPLTEEGFEFWPYEPRVQWSLHQEQIEELWKVPSDGDEFRYFFGKAVINPKVSYEWDFEDSELEDSYVSEIEQPIYRSLRLGSDHLKIVQYVLIPSNGA